jgi:hypothetical protein
MIRKQAREPVPTLTEARPDLAAHPDLVAAVARACAKNPDDRPASAEGLAEELARTMGHLTHLPAPAPLPTFHSSPPVNEVASPFAPLPAAPAPPASVERGRGLRLAAVVALALGFVVAGAALYLLQAAAPGR